MVALNMFGPPALPSVPMDNDWPQPNVPFEPPGQAARLVRYIYHSAVLPVPEVAIAATLGLLAGICGLAWNTPTRAQLNLYVVLVARSGVGKEHARQAISTLMSAATADMQHLQRHVNWNDIASAPALIRTCAASPAFVHMQGEWGHVLQRMASPRSHDGPMGELRRVLTMLYGNKMPVGLTYSDSAKNVEQRNPVAFSILAETTPGTFFGAVSGDMLEDGFMSRFNVIEYLGDRPDENLSPGAPPPESLVSLLKVILIHAEHSMRNIAAGRGPIAVAVDEDARVRLDAFRDECSTEVRNAGENESIRQLWNRANLKVLKVASLLAVVDNPAGPTIFVSQADWSIELVRRDIESFRRRIQGGDVGDDDNARLDKLVMFCKDYLQKPMPRGYGIPDEMHEVGVVPRKYFQVRSKSLPAFSKHRLGGIRALDDAIRSLCDNGYLLEVERVKAMDEFGFQGRCFRIVNLPGGVLD